MSIAIVEMLIANRIRVFPFPHIKGFSRIVHNRAVPGALMSIRRLRR
jgi:hypothetical protein